MTTEEIEERGQIDAAICCFVRDLIAAGRRIEKQRDGALRDWQRYSQLCLDAREELAREKGEE